ncbi:hypothetical protein EAE96_000532 [Botrytis aclada]|nr:hypothetical protein EAE96_000532 [Botrytis aclada]
MADPSPSKVLGQMEIDASSSTVDPTSPAKSSPANEAAANEADAAEALQSRIGYDEMIAEYQAERDNDYHYNVIPIPELPRHLRERGIRPSYRDALVTMLLVDDDNRDWAQGYYRFTYRTVNCFFAEHCNFVYEADFEESEVGDVSPDHGAQVGDDQSGNNEVDKADMMDVEQPELSADHSTQHQVSEEL